MIRVTLQGCKMQFSGTVIFLEAMASSSEFKAILSGHARSLVRYYQSC